MRKVWNQRERRELRAHIVQLPSPMLIKYGFSITIAVTQPTPVIARLDVHPDRRADIAEEDRFTISGWDLPPPRLDAFGNLCRRILVEPGEANLELSGIIRDSGAFEAQLTNE